MAGPESVRAEAKARTRAFLSSPPRPGRRLYWLLLPGLLLLLGSAESGAQTSQDAAVQVSAAVASVSPPQIQLSWPLYAASGYTVYRKGYSDTSWGSPLATLPGNATGYLDATPLAGARYEYQVARSGSYFAVGYVASGIELPLVDSRGKVVLIVDGTQAAAIPTELARLRQDLVGDG